MKKINKNNEKIIEFINFIITRGRLGAFGSPSALTKCLIESFGIIRDTFTSMKQAGSTGLDQVEGTTRTFIKSHVRSFIISSAWILSLIIFIMLIRGNVESNPGMKRAPKLTIVTYNCNGLGDRRKLVRLLAKIGKLIANGGIVLLQETHLVNLNYFNMLWKHKYISNCKKSNAGGVMILFGNEYTVNSYESDEGGRLIIASIQKEENKFIIANAYFPNDHREAINFTESMYEKLLEFQHTYPNHETICAGDFNTCLKKSEDSMNRVGNNYEIQLSISIIENNKITDLEDAYRLVHPKDGYTWKRGTCYSRLDYIFISKSLRHRVSGANTNWAFEASDHAAVQLDLTIKDEISKGPGIVKVNSKILEDVERRRNVEGEIERMMSQIGEDWNPHTILEFLKVCIRTAMAEETGNRRKVMRSEVEELEQEINQMEEMKITATRDSKDDEDIEKARRIEPLNIAINTLKSKLSNVKTKISETREFFNKTKWFEWGEKPNKFFLNLAKSRQNRNLITEIRNGESSHKGQKDVMEGIRNFYKELYERKNLNRNLDSRKFYEKCPSLSEKNKRSLDQDLTLEELKKALHTCKDSAPGPDGIPYQVYKKLWKITGPILLNAWKYSMITETLTNSHLESVITLLPKEGKDVKDIKNWRPITLSNCDSKIITKAMSIRTAAVLGSIIDTSQTAYVPGRSVTDNLRTNFYYKSMCARKNIASVLISLDAKKAFDSVDHAYIEKTLRIYGFGETYIKMFKVLYKDIRARIMVNGHLSDPIEINRGVKQGDALSCAIFIICIDPLLRNINANQRIKNVQQVHEIEQNFKAAAYADDISIICKSDKVSVQQVFEEYEFLTKLSGLELNADKTEILILDNSNSIKYSIRYNDCTFDIGTTSQLKICGLVFSSNIMEEYDQNVISKIRKLEYEIKKWSHRYLTMEGKALIVKTFGLSQLIYNMQTYKFKSEEIQKIERIIFKFLWSTTEQQNGIDRIRRSIMKNEYEHGGMKITDVECLDRALKLRQYFRANTAKHEIANIQSRIMRNNPSQEYSKITSEETICESAQATINIITDYNRMTYVSSLDDEHQSNDRNMINEVSSIDLQTFLTRRNKVFHLCILKQITKAGINTLGELMQQFEYEQNVNLTKAMEMIIRIIPTHLVSIAKLYIDGINSDLRKMENLRLDNECRKPCETITVSELQKILKKALNRVEVLKTEEKNNIAHYDNRNITTFRRLCKNLKLRNIYFRLIHNDFFTHEKMKRYGMTKNDECPRCKIREDTRHLMWGCVHSTNIWALYNNTMIKIGNQEEVVREYEDLFKPGLTKVNAIIKIKMIQELIQINRPMNWKSENIMRIIKEMKNIQNTLKVDGRDEWNVFDSLI